MFVFKQRCGALVLLIEMNPVIIKTVYESNSSYPKSSLDITWVVISPVLMMLLKYKD